MEEYWGVDVYLYMFLTLPLERGECSMEVRLTNTLLMETHFNFRRSPLSIKIIFKIFCYI
jgi:hypothetical protein